MGQNLKSLPSQKIQRTDIKVISNHYMKFKENMSAKLSLESHLKSSKDMVRFLQGVGHQLTFLSTVHKYAHQV